MLTLLSFLIVIIGCINWLSIGMLQYDFIAGLFGYQASIFSRIAYILIGICAMVLIFKSFKDRGKINLINFGSKKKEKEMEIVSNEHLAYQNSNVEASKDFEAQNNNPRQQQKISGKDYSENDLKNIDSPQKNSIFNDMK